MSERKVLGITVGQITPYRLRFRSTQPPRVGQFVIVESEGKRYLGLVSSTFSENPYLSDIALTPQYVERTNRLTGNRVVYEATVNILGEISEEGISTLKSPPVPGMPVYVADVETLWEVFRASDERHVRIGVLLSNPEVPVHINLEQAVLRHMAVLAVTGAGKSNTVGVLLERIAEKNGTALILDIHGEYTNLKLDNGQVNVIEPVIDPALLDLDELAGLLGIDMDSAAQMYYLLSVVKDKVDDRWFSGSGDAEDNDFDSFMRQEKDYLKELEHELNNILEDKEERGVYGRDTITRLLNRLNLLSRRFKSLFRNNATPLLDMIKEHQINVLNLSGLDEDKSDVIISHILYKVLRDRKGDVDRQKLRAPIVVILEEAHLFASRGRKTRSRYVLNRIAREGRKFGVGLWLVSQRPKGLDPDILSQMNNMIILKLVEPEDQAHVQRSSEMLSRELVEYLPALNPGEAIVIGNMTRIPLLVRIDKSRAKMKGQDPPVISSWKKSESGKKGNRFLDDLV